MARAQTLEEYALQRTQYLAHGPKTDTETSLNDLAANLDLVDHTCKTSRHSLLHACELAYYDRDYRRCIALAEHIKPMWAPLGDKSVVRDCTALDQILVRARSKLEEAAE